MITVLVLVDPVGPKEIAERLDVRRATIDKWMWKGVMPEPHRISGNPVWEWETIKQWAAETGRPGKCGNPLRARR